MSHGAYQLNNSGVPFRENISPRLNSLPLTQLDDKRNSIRQIRRRPVSPHNKLLTSKPGPMGQLPTGTMAGRRVASPADSGDTAALSQHSPNPTNPLTPAPQPDYLLRQLDSSAGRVCWRCLLIVAAAMCVFLTENSEPGGSCGQTTHTQWDKPSRRVTQRGSAAGAGIIRLNRNKADVDNSQSTVAVKMASGCKYFGCRLIIKRTNA